MQRNNLRDKLKNVEIDLFKVRKETPTDYEEFLREIKEKYGIEID